MCASVCDCELTGCKVVAPPLPEPNRAEEWRRSDRRHEEQSIRRSHNNGIAPLAKLRSRGKKFIVPKDFKLRISRDRMTENWDSTASKQSNDHRPPKPYYSAVGLCVRG